MAKPLPCICLLFSGCEEEEEEEEEGEMRVTFNGWNYKLGAVFNWVSETMAV